MTRRKSEQEIPATRLHNTDSDAPSEVAIDVPSLSQEDKEALDRAATSSAKFKVLVDRVLELSRLSVEDLSAAMDTEHGFAIGKVKSRVDLAEGRMPPSYRGTWKDLKPTSPVPLTEEEYYRFLAGTHPRTDSEREEKREAYGAHLEREIPK